MFGGADPVPVSVEKLVFLRFSNVLHGFPMVSVGGFNFTWLLTSCEETHALGMLYESVFFRPGERKQLPTIIN